MSASNRRFLSPQWRAVVGAFIRVLEQKHPYTRGHSQRVQAQVIQLTEYCRWSAFDRRCASVAALLHDIGKIAVERSTLNNGHQPLSPDQQEELTDHPYTGAQIVHGLFPAEVTLGILQHHERWDGRIHGPRRGYPLGLQGEQISPIARAIAICDAFDALTTQRSYNVPTSAHDALHTIAAEAGKHFDPKLTRSFVRMLRSTLPPDPRR